MNTLLILIISMELINYSEIKAVDNWPEFYVQRFLGENNSKNRSPYVFQIPCYLKEYIGILKQYWEPKTLSVKLHGGCLEPT